MAIMVAGGMTFAVPGIIPAAEAANANLFVSAENSQFNNYFAGPQVIEVTVIDSNISDTDEGRGEPDVTVNGKDLRMVQATDGNWYGYFADQKHAIRADKLAGSNGSGLEFGDFKSPSNNNATNALKKALNTQFEINPNDSAGVFVKTDIGSYLNVIRAAKAINTDLTGKPGQIGIDENMWPFIQLYNFNPTGKVVVEYNKGGGPQTTTLKFDTVDDFAGIDLDRRTYPQGAQVHVTVTDAWLNIDPTDEDSWTWYTNGTRADDAYYQIFDDSGAVKGLNGEGNPAMDPVNSDVNLMQEDAVFKLNVQAQGSEPVIKLQDNDDTNYEAIHQEHLVKPVTLTERGPNSGVFGTYDESDKSVLYISGDAERGTSAIVDYNDTPTSVLVAHDSATIEIQPSNDDWASGEAIPVVLMDADANKNSRADEDLTLSKSNTALIPTLVTGDPFTLGEGSEPSAYFWDGTVSDEYGATIATTTGTMVVSTYRTISGTTDANPPSDVGPLVQPFSDRAMITQGSGTTGTQSKLLFDVGTTLEDLRATISKSDPNDWNNEDFKGFNLLNYDLRSLDDITGIDDIEISVRITSAFNSTYSNSTDILIHRAASPQGLVLLENNDQFVRYDDLFDKFEGDDSVAILYEWANPVEIPEGTYPIVTDFFSFGFSDDGNQAHERVSNQIIRLELEEDADNTGKFIGTLEYTMVNQLNILERDTYGGLTTISDEPSFIVIEDLTDEDAVRVNYLDLGRDGVSTQIADQEEAPSHSGVVTLDSNSYKVADTVTVTLSDPDLNVDSDLVDIFTVVRASTLPNSDAPEPAFDAIGTAELPTEDSDKTPFSFGPLGRLLDVTFNDEIWTSANIGDNRGECDRSKIDIDDTGLSATGFTLVENGTATGIFTGDFQIPSVYCQASGEVASVTGTDIEVNYVDFRDASGEIIEVGDSAGVRANTGSVSLDRTVYPVPWGTTEQSGDDGGSAFTVHRSGWVDNNDDGRTYATTAHGETLGEGVLTIHARINDPDFDVSASGEDTIAQDVADGTQGPLKISVSRGSEEVVLAYAGGNAAEPGRINVGDDNATGTRHMGPIAEIAPDAGIFELDFDVLYTDGPSSSTCPDTDLYTQLDTRWNADEPLSRFDAVPDRNENYCILQGDILTVEYTDPTDASGDPNTVTDSATFDLRNGVLQSDKSVYIIGSDMILTVIEPDWDLDNDAAETYDLDVIEWDSDAATVTMGNLGGPNAAAAFDPEPTDLRETGDSTGIFQVVIEIPDEIDGDALERGEQIVLEYTDWGPSGADYVGQEEEDVKLTVFTSNFGATIELDQKVYSWTDKVYVTIVAPDHNFDSDLVDEIGESERDPIRIATRGNDLDKYKLVETGTDTGIFTGEVILTGFLHDADGNSATGIDRGFDTNPRTEPANNGGPTNGFLAATDDDGLTVSFEFSEDETVVGSALIRWNIGEVQWLEQSYPASGSGVLRVVDPDMNLNPESVDNFAVDVWSDTDSGGIDLTVTETNEATGIFEGTVQFTITDASSGHRLRVSEGDTITGEYDDNTLPSPYNTSDQIGIKATSIIGTIVPPLERAPASSLRTVDTLGNALDSVSVDQQVQITADLVSGQDKDQEFAYIVQVQDSSGVTVELAWITGTLSPGQSFSPSKSWVPTMPGTYTATAFVWESVSTPTALSPPAELTITVN